MLDKLTRKGSLRRIITLHTVQVVVRCKNEISTLVYFLHTGHGAEVGTASSFRLFYCTIYKVR